MLGPEATMEIRINGQRYKDWHRIPDDVRQELVESGIFLDGDGTGVPPEMLPSAGATNGASRRYALTINGAPYDAEHPVPALLSSVILTLGHHGDSRPPYGRSRQGPRTFRSIMPTGERPGPPVTRQPPEAARPQPGSAPTGQPGQARSGAAWDAPADEDTLSGDAGGWEPESSAAPQRPAPEAAALTSWQGPASAARPQPVRAEPHPGATGSRGYGRWEPASGSTRNRATSSDVIVETTSVPRWAVFAALLLLAVLVVVLLALTGT
jgi:hypothetical protein